MSDMNDRDLARFAEELARFDRPSAPLALRAQLRASLLAAPVVVVSPRIARVPWRPRPPNTSPRPSA